MKIYLENCCFNRTYDPQDDNAIYVESEAKLFIQHEIKNGKLELVWSYMLSYENADNPDPDAREKIENWSQLAVSDVVESDTLIRKSLMLVKEGLKPKDAVHVACAIEAKAAIFFTTDKGILKKREHIAEVEILNPVEYILWKERL
ncbi:MAG: PIN domain-containing protein [Spirochaetes bacterium]|nr:PIN domain-containing protein [Spirochaetota bacterium]